MRLQVAPLADRHDKHFDAQLSSQLTEKLGADDVDGMLTALTDAGLSTEHLSYHISCDTEHQSSSSCWGQRTSKTSHNASFSRVAHLCMLMQCRQVLRYISTQHSHHLMLSDKSSSGLLHSLAMANVLLRNSQTNCRLSDGFDTFQTDAFAILRDAECTNSQLPSSSSLLHSLCLMENASGLRPLEFAMLIGAYSTFQHILNVHGYILMKEVNHGIRIRSTYNLNEYDLMSGDRRDKSPMLMLTLISSDQADALAQSGLLDAPVIKKWIKSVTNCTGCTGRLRNAFLSSATGIFSPVTITFEIIASMTRIGYEYETGFFRYGDLLKSQLNSSDPLFDEQVRSQCSPADLRSYLTDPGYEGNSMPLVKSPIFIFKYVNRSYIVGSTSTLAATVGIYMCIQLIVIIYNTVRDYQFFGSRWMRSRGRASFLVQSHFFTAAYILSFCMGGTFVLAMLQFDGVLDCTDYVTGRTEGNQRLLFLTNLCECTAVLCIFFSLFSLLDVYEMVAKQVAFLSICFRKMLSKFVLVLPLLVFWAYLVFGTLFYMADFKGQEFKSQTDVFYSPLRLLLNTASPSHNVSTVILHTLFVMIVSLTISNFIIAVISNEFNAAAIRFDVIFVISNLNCSLRTWRLYSFLTRFWRLRITKRSNATVSNIGVISVWSLKNMTHSHRH